MADSAIGDFLAFRSNKKLRRLAITCIVLVCSVVYCSCIFRMAPKAFATTDNDNCFNVPDKVTASVDDSYNITWSDARLKNLSTDTLTLATIKTGPLKEIDDETKEFLEKIKLKITINTIEVYNSTIGEPSEPSINVAPNGVLNIKYSIVADSEQIDRLIKEDNLIAVAFKCTTSAQPAPAPVDEPKPLIFKENDVTYRYFPIFNTVPSDVDWYKGLSNGNPEIVLSADIQSMNDICSKDVDGYVAKNGASFFAVRAYNETWNQAFGSPSYPGKATSYLGSGFYEAYDLSCESLSNSGFVNAVNYDSTVPYIENVSLNDIKTAYGNKWASDGNPYFWSCRVESSSNALTWDGSMWFAYDRNSTWCYTLFKAKFE